MSILDIGLRLFSPYDTLHTIRTPYFLSLISSSSIIIFICIDIGSLYLPLSLSLSLAEGSTTYD